MHLAKHSAYFIHVTETLQSLAGVEEHFLAVQKVGHTVQAQLKSGSVRQRGHEGGAQQTLANIGFARVYHSKQ